MSSNVFKTKALHERNRLTDLEQKELNRFENPNHAPTAGNLLAATKGVKQKSTSSVGPLMLRPNEPKRERWDYFIMIIATWNCLSLPVELAYEPEILLGAVN